MKQLWFVYVRWWDTGRRETIRTTVPDELLRERCMVLAMLPAPRVIVLPGKLRQVNA